MWVSPVKIIAKARCLDASRVLSQVAGFDEENHMMKWNSKDVSDVHIRKGNAVFIDNRSPLLGVVHGEKMGGRLGFARPK